MAHVLLQQQVLCRLTLSNLDSEGRRRWSSPAAAAHVLPGVVQGGYCSGGRGCATSFVGNSLLGLRAVRSRSFSFASVGGAGKNFQEKRTVRKMAEAANIPPGISKDVQILNALGERLSGVIVDPGSKEVVILCHGFRSSKKSTTLGVVATTLVSAGITSFRFDFSGNGESEGDFAYGNYWKEVEDLRSVVEYWRGEGREVAAIVGHSKGGNVVILYASKYHDVSTVVNVSGRFDLNIGQKERFGEKGMRKLEKDGFLDVKDKAGVFEYRVTLKSLEERLSTDMDGAAKSIPEDVRVLTVHGSADEIVKVENAHDFAERIPNHTLRIFDGANHNYEGERNKLASLVLEFIQGKVSKI